MYLTIAEDTRQGQRGSRYVSPYAILQLGRVEPTSYNHYPVIKDMHRTLLKLDAGRFATQAMDSQWIFNELIPYVKYSDQEIPLRFQWNRVILMVNDVPKTTPELTQSAQITGFTAEHRLMTMERIGQAMEMHISYLRHRDGLDVWDGMLISMLASIRRCTEVDIMRALLGCRPAGLHRELARQRYGERAAVVGECAEFGVFQRGGNYINVLKALLVKYKLLLELSSTGGGVTGDKDVTEDGTLGASVDTFIVPNGAAAFLRDPQFQNRYSDYGPDGNGSVREDESSTIYHQGHRQRFFGLNVFEAPMYVESETNPPLNPLLQRYTLGRKFIMTQLPSTEGPRRPSCGDIFIHNMDPDLMHRMRLEEALRNTHLWIEEGGGGWKPPVTAERLLELWFHKKEDGGGSNMVTFGHFIQRTEGAVDDFSSSLVHMFSDRFSLNSMDVADSTNDRLLQALCPIWCATPEDVSRILREMMRTTTGTTTATTVGQLIEKVIWNADASQWSRWQFLVQHHLPVPLCVMLMRPYEVYEMGNCILMKSGENTGMVAARDPDVAIGFSKKRQTIYANVTTYEKPLIMAPENLLVIPSLMFYRYVSGANCSYVKPKVPLNVNSIFAIPLCLSEAARTASSTSFLHENDNGYDLQMLYREIYHDIWDLDQRLRDPSQWISYHDKAMPPVSPRCFQGLQVSWSSEEQRFCHLQRSQGHLSDILSIPGARRIIDGFSMMIPDTPDLLNNNLESLFVQCHNNTS